MQIYKKNLTYIKPILQLFLYTFKMFNLFRRKKEKKSLQGKIFVCKHCKLVCKDCTTMYCFSCYAKLENPCPRCGKRNIDPK
ncbi:hypothetical protein CRV04_00345 [Candidatus Marinarcus aquaticus]|uniref:Uncharacterized protein n=1 Tax=Candidatus Marinarcus aquaticus TaxID=2044504 RepID=A0A4Q0XW93_9BACT|nr:hypothetical protein CRV04_00345 [Candidatus Marinarcus aquaticus]